VPAQLQGLLGLSRPSRRSLHTQRVVVHGAGRGIRYQNLLRNLIAADFETQAQILKCVTTPFVASEKVSRLIEAAGMKSLAEDPREIEDEIINPG